MRDNHTSASIFRDIVALLLSLSVCSTTSATAARLRPKTRMPTIIQPQRQRADLVPSSADCTWKFYTQPLSHFAEGATVGGNGTYQQRVCVVDKYWSSTPEPSLLKEGAVAPAREPR